MLSIQTGVVCTWHLYCVTQMVGTLFCLGLSYIAAYCDTDIAYRVPFCAVFCDALVYRSGPSNYSQVIACDFDST